ncbi:MAG: pentapeptide repeat-containing protein [Nostocaceae cyanobacterium]|nr:pentapeptide repeat-containing protein [Nostocaceae cyanobacterium]
MCNQIGWRFAPAIAWLKRAIVRDTNLYSALPWCSLTEADLSGTDLNHINATCASFCRSDIGLFEYAILAHAS